MARRKCSNRNSDKIDNGNCNEALISVIIGSFDNYPDKERFRPLTPEEETKLVKRLRKKNIEELRAKLIEHNVFLAAQFIKKYKNRFFSVSTEDLVSNIYWGLVSAAQKFDPYKGNRFCTFAYWHLKKWVLYPFQTNQWKVSNATTRSFDCLFDHGKDGNDDGKCSESAIIDNVDASCTVNVIDDPATAAELNEERVSKESAGTSKDQLLEKMRAYALSAAFTDEEHEFYRMKYIDQMKPHDVRIGCSLSISEYRRIDKKITSSLRDFMLKNA